MGIPDTAISLHGDRSRCYGRGGGTQAGLEGLGGLLTGTVAELVVWAEWELTRHTEVVGHSRQRLKATTVLESVAHSRTGFDSTVERSLKRQARTR